LRSWGFVCGFPLYFAERVNHRVVDVNDVAVVVRNHDADAGVVQGHFDAQDFLPPLYARLFCGPTVFAACFLSHAASCLVASSSWIERDRSPAAIFLGDAFGIKGIDADLLAEMAG